VREAIVPGPADRFPNMLREQISKVPYVLRHEGILAVGRRILGTLSEELQRLYLPVVGTRFSFFCPCCEYVGRFLGVRGQKHCQCPRCGALPRHRLLRLVLDALLEQRPPGSMSILHIAPEPTLQHWLERQSRAYVAADLAHGLQVNSFTGQLAVVCDLRRLPFQDRSFDLVIASHVLEHIKEDWPAIQEIYRVLAWEGIALLPVPIVAGDLTIEYHRPHPREQYHVRAPGLDYFERYREAGFNVTVRSSAEFPEQYQIFAYEDRTKWPSAERPMLPKQNGARHKEYLPICQKPGNNLSRPTAEGNREFACGGSGARETLRVR